MGVLVNRTIDALLFGTVVQICVISLSPRVDHYVG